MIRAESVCRRYGTTDHQVVAVNDLNLTVEAGERVAIVGRSGSGKSTVLNLLAGLDRPTEGTLTIDSCRLHELSRDEMAEYRLKTVGMIFQSFQLIPQRTALQNVELPLILSGVSSKERKRRAAECLGQVGLSARSTHFPYEMSGGEQQRVAIARALVNRPGVLLADEPTGNLDSSTAAEIVNLLNDVCRNSDVTFLLVTHDEPLAERFGTRRLTMADGVLSETPRESPA
ncbi:MAG: ABC transporter ATP-binding protein [Planctomycetaceae bacterium]